MIGSHAFTTTGPIRLTQVGAERALGLIPLGGACPGKEGFFLPSHITLPHPAPFLHTVIRYCHPVFTLAYILLA